MADWQLTDGDARLFRRGKEVASLSLTTGQEKAVLGGLGDEVEARAASSGGTLFVLTGPRPGKRSPEPVTLQALPTSSGGRRWSASPWPGATLPLLCGPVVSSGTVFAAAATKAALVDASTGRELWSRDLGALVGRHAASGPGVVVLVDLKGVEALSLADGHPLWRFPIPPPAFNPSRAPVVFGGRVYVPDSDSTIAALELASGALAWRSPPLPLDFRHPVLVGAAGVVVPTVDGLARLSPAGALLWADTYPALRMRSTRPVLAWFRNAIAAGGADGLFVVSPESGQVLWRLRGLGQIDDLAPYGDGLAAAATDGKISLLAP